MAEATSDDPVYVAVSKDVGESESTLLWALTNFPRKKLFLLHVHQQTPMNPISSGLQQSEITAIQESELASSYESLYKYRDICEEQGVVEHDVDVRLIEAENVGEGIVELIYQNNIEMLIMGAAADSHYTEGMVNITSTKAEYVSRHAPHCCKIWLVCNGNFIQTREGGFGLVGSSESLSILPGLDSALTESLSSRPGLDSALIPYEGAGRAEHGTESHAPSSSEDRSARGLETMHYEEQRWRLEIEELKREKERYDQMVRERWEALSSSFGVTQILYNDEVRRRREAEEELNRAKAEIEDMKKVQKELEEQRDEAINANEELLRHLSLEEGAPSSHSRLQWFVSNEPPPYFICPISKEIMRNPHVAADGYTYEEEEFKTWLRVGDEKSPMTNLRLENHNLTPNLILRTAINDWLQQNQ
ncbi:unnamed protein product [Arabis nemorensis]|uniref:RING-type E3 ubiquitin transferase n=1 Tax=Arabis nemorensis TaxID=586526 RepID=A0A565AJT0_9BRAS|nr:unnamed protein product [Arabis nemorensis]